MQERIAAEAYYRKRNLNFLTYCLIFVLIWVESSFYSVNVLPGTAKLILALVSIVPLVLFRFANVINIKKFLFAILLLAWILIFGLISSSNAFKQTFIMFIHCLVGAVFSIYIDEDEFIEKFNNIVYFLAIYSLIGFIINIFLFSLVEKFPTIYSMNTGITYYNLFFTVVCNNTYVVRNYGMFWEPGAFSVFLCIALFFELIKSKNLKLTRIIIISITILTTKSTLGIIAVILLYLIYFIRNPIAFTGKNRKLLFCVVFAIIILLFFIPHDFYSEIFDKLYKLDNYGNVNSSMQTRLNAVYYMLNAFFNSAGFGIGIENYLYIQETYCNDMATATMANWLAIYGILWGGICICGYLRYFLKSFKFSFSAILILIFAVLLLATENFLMNPFIYALIFYGLGEKQNEKLSLYCN